MNDKLADTEKTESNFKALKKEIKLLGEKFENKSLDFNHLKSELEKGAEKANQKIKNEKKEDIGVKIL